MNITVSDLEIKREDCLYIDPFELEDISILEQNFHHDYPKYEVDEIPDFELDDIL